MKRLIRAADIRKLVFGSPSLQLGDNTITITEVSNAIINNQDIRKHFTEKQYKKVMLDIPNLSRNQANYANYGCYGSGENAQFYAIEVYKFETGNKNDEYLFVIIGKPFTCKIVKNEQDLEEDNNEIFPEDVVVDYLGQVESDYFFGSYTEYMGGNFIDFKGKQIQLIKDIPINTSPEDFYIKFINNEF